MEEKKNVQNLVNASNTISGSFAKLKFVTVICLIGTFLTAAGCVVYSYMSITSLSNKIYVLDKGQVLTASRQEVTLTRADEVRAQAERFHELFFTATPNRDVVNRNLEKAMQLCADRSAYTYFKDTEESGFYQRIAQTNAVREVAVDSIAVDMKSYPYRVAVFTSLYLTRSSLMTKEAVITRMSMIDVPRTDTNLNGLKIENFEVISKKEVDRRKRQQL